MPRKASDNARGWVTKCHARLATTQEGDTMLHKAPERQHKGAIMLSKALKSNYNYDSYYFLKNRRRGGGGRARTRMWESRSFTREDSTAVSG